MEASVWQRDLPALPLFPALNGDIRCSVAVIGAGMTGMLTAFFLRERGFDVVLLEERIPGCGVTSRSAANITVSHRFAYSNLLDQLGASMTRRYAQRQLQAVEDFNAVVKRLDIPCDFHRAPAYLFSRQDCTRLRREFCAAQTAELPVQWMQETELPVPVSGAIRFENQAYFHPLKFLYALVPHLRIFSHTRAERMENGVVHTKYGRVRADHIVITARLPFSNFPELGALRSRKEKFCALALEGVPPIGGIYQEAAAGGLSLRPYSGGILLAGGRYQLGPLPLPERFSHLQRLAQGYWQNCRITAGWTFHEWFPENDVSFVNAYVGRKADLYLAPALSARGMTFAMTAARFISERIAESRA